MKTIELSASRLRLACWLLLSATALIIFGLFLNDQVNYGSVNAVRWWVWLGLAASIGLFVIFAWQLVRPARLVLDEKGVTFTSSFGASSEILWRDVDKFFVLYPGAPLKTGNRLVAWNLKAKARSHTALARINRNIGADGALDDSWAVSADDLVDQLNRMKQHFDLT